MKKTFGFNVEHFYGGLFLGKKTISRFWILILTVLLQACSGGSGGGATDQDPSVVLGDGDVGGFTYSGPSPANTEIQAFKREFYDNLVISGRCGDCHTSDGSGTTLFVDKEDVNLAWQQANTVVNLLDPASSTVVQRVANGHNCWLGSDQTATCRSTMIAYINNWASSSAGGVTTVQLLPRTSVDPTGTKRFPVNPPTSFSSTNTNSLGLYPLLTTYCSDCHRAESDFPQSPYFASADLTQAYAAAQTKIDLINPKMSRIVIRLREEGHNCWSGNCENDADQLEAAIIVIADGIDIDEIEASIQGAISRAQVLASDGILASNGGRYEEDIVAEWKFSEGMNPADIDNCLTDSQCTLTSSDTSGVQPEITLSLSGDVQLFSSGGIRFNNGSARGLASTSLKLRDTLAAAGEYSIEAWLIPDNVSQEETSIISYSGISDNRNFMFGQSLYNYDFLNRSSATGADGSGGPSLSTADDDELAQATLQHVVLTFDSINGRRIYVNGEFSGVADGQGGGNMDNWNDAFSVVIGNDSSGMNPWKGIVRYIALHSRALNDEQILQNNDVGIGLDFYLMFSISHLLDSGSGCLQGSGDDRVNQCYVVFKVSQFDEFSYSFSSPFFVSLDEDNLSLTDVRIKGIYLGINGKLASSGQAFSSVDVNLNNSIYTSGGVTLTNPIGAEGSVILLENGATVDQFFLAFEEINGTSGVKLTPVDTPSNFVYGLKGGDNSNIAVRTFEEINQSFAEITGVTSTNTDVHTVFYGSGSGDDQGLQRQLPSIADFRAYQGSHQTAVAQLAIAYCDVLVDSTQLRNGFFNDGAAFNFSLRADLVSTNSWRNKVIDPLLEAVLIFDGEPLVIDSQPDRATSREILSDLILNENDSKPYKYNSVLNDYISQPDGNPDGLARCNGVGGGFECPAGRTNEVVKAVCASVLGSAAVLLQ